MMLRPNHTIAPTNNVAIRRAMLAAIDQNEVVNAVMGADPANGTAGVGFLATGKKEVDEAGLDAIRRRHSKAEIKEMLNKAGYAGEKLVLLHATDHIFFNPMGSVTADLLTKAGFTVDAQAMDWPTVQTRRMSKEPVDKAGWSYFTSVVAVSEYRDLLGTGFMRGNGKDGWFGWPSDAKIEAIYGDWLGSADPAEQTRLEREYQLQAFEMLPFIPMGRFRQTSAWRDTLTGIEEGPSVVFWGMRKGG